MALIRQGLVKEDMQLGYGTTEITADNGGTLVGNKIGIHSFLGAAYLAAHDQDGDDAGEKINAAIAALPSTGGVVDARGLTGTQSAAATIELSKKVLLLLPDALTLAANPGISVTAHRCVIEGRGQQASILTYNPSASGAAAIQIKSIAADAIAQCAVRGVAIDGAGNTQATKAAIRVTDGEEIIIHDIAVSNWSSSGKDCIGLQLRGRQLHSFKNLTITADNPISIEDNPNTTIDCDHYRFEDCYLTADDTQPIVKIADGVNLYNVTFDGAQAWVAGKHGLYWSDTTASLASQNLSLKNVRWEQATDATGYFIYISRTANLIQLNLENLSGALNSNGFYLRTVLMANLDSVMYLGGLDGLNMDSTVRQLRLNNVRLNDNAASVSLTASGISGTYYEGGNTFEFIPAPLSGGAMAQQINPSATLGFNQLEPITITVSGGTVVKLAGNTLMGMLFITALSSAASAIYAINGAFNNVTEIADTLTAFGTSAGADDHNIYSSGGEYKLQNNTVSTVTYKINFMGVGEH